MRTRSGLPLFDEKPDSIIGKNWRPLASEVGYKIPFRRPYPQWQRVPQTRLSSGSVCLQTQAVSFSPKYLLPKSWLYHCPVSPNLLLHLRSWAEAVTETLLRAAQSWTWFGAGSVHLMVSEQRLNYLCWAELLPRAFQVPLCKLISLPSAVEWTPVWWAVLLCWAMCPIPSPFTFPVLRNSPRAKSGLRAKASGGQRILKMQGSEEWQSFFCEAFTSYGSQPWLWQEWMEGGIQNTGQQIIPTLRSEATSHLYNQVLLTLEWKIFGMSAILYSLTPPPPPWDRSSMTLINRRIIKTLFSLPLYDAM